VTRSAVLDRRNLWRHTGVRLAILQVVIVVVAFGFAGLVARADIQAATERTLRREIQGEMGAMRDEVLRHGEPRLAATVQRRTLLWRGFEYGLLGPGGELRGGRLADARGREGWSVLAGRGAWGQPRRFLALTERTPGGGWLSVGKDLADVSREMRLLTWRLATAGLVGALVCVATWMVFARDAWRRLSAISATAHAVSEGRLGVRVPKLGRRRGDDIDEVGSALNQMLDRIGGLIEQLRRVTTDVAHDLRTPLARMRLKIEALEHAPDLSLRHRASLGAVQVDLDELMRTFDALLQMAEIEGRNLSQDGVVFDAGEVAGQMAEAFRPDVEESGRLLLMAQDAPAPVKGDPALIAQLIANLIENAMRHTPPGSSIRIAAGGGSGESWLSVADDGHGIAPHLRQAVLAPYFRLDESRSTPGSGLGLSIVAAIASRHEARLQLDDNHPGLRVTATFRPPLEASPAEPTALAVA